MEAARIGAPGAAWTLLAFGADPTLSNRDGVSALTCAAMSACDELVEYFVEAGCSVHEKTLGGLSVLMTCSGQPSSRVAACIRILVAAGAVTDERDTFGRTALHSAASAGNREAVLALVDAGAPLNAEDHRGETPLDGARGAEVERTLRDRGGVTGRYARLTAYEQPLVDHYGIDVLEVHDHPGLTALLVGDREGLSAHRDQLSTTPPHLPGPFHVLALSRAHWDLAEVARAMLAAGVSIERADPDGKSALHLALLKHRPLAQLLLDLGADLHDPGAKAAALALIEWVGPRDLKLDQRLSRLLEDLRRRLDENE